MKSHYHEGVSSPSTEKERTNEDKREINKIDTNDGPIPQKYHY